MPKNLKTCPECYSEYEDTFETCPADSAVLRKIERDPLVGTMLANRYFIESVVGRGGMGVVYKATHQTMDKPMAIKMLHSHLVAEADAVKRFHREAKTVSQVRHHHIINLYDFGMSSQRQPFLVMDYLEGTSLKSVMKETGPVPFERTEHIYMQVVDALATAHSMDLVHRDLKPENIMLSHYNNDDDWVTLVDFGLSKLKEVKKEDDSSYQITKIGDVCGSPPYMSPEQCMSSQVVDPRSDIYALGICVYETLTGKLPFNAKSAIEMLDCHLYATPIPFNQALPHLKVCTELTHVINKALQKDPDQRHQNVDEFGSHFRDAIRRDAVKLRAHRHRLETSAYHDLASEAAALAQEQDQVRTDGEQLEGVQFVRDQKRSSTAEMRSPAQHKTTNRRLLETEVGLLEKIKLHILFLLGKDLNSVAPANTWTRCPFCNSKVEPGVRVCLKCQHPLMSASGVRSATEVKSSRMLSAAQRLLSLIFLAVLLYGTYVVFTNQTIRESLSRMVAALNSSNRPSDK